jgi:hypothetical protein
MAASPSDSEDHELLAAAGELPEHPAEETPRCPACGSALDDIAKMTDMQVLQHMRTEMYRDLLRNLRAGTATHQEKAIARGILRDNKVVADNDSSDEPDDGVEVGGETYSFKPGDLSETEGG